MVWSVEVARALAPDSHIILSTDSEEIADVVRAAGLKVDYMRPPELATDTSGTREALLDAMEYADRTGIQYDKICLLQPTSPLRTTADVQACLDAYRPDIDMAVTVCDADDNPYYNCFETDAAGFLKIAKGDGLYTRRQDAPPAWKLNGAVYVINPASLRTMPLGAMKRRLPCAMAPERSIDIDSALDLAVAETILKNSSCNSND